VFFVFFLLGGSMASEVYVSTFVTVCMAQTQCSETSAHKIQTPGIHPKERIQHSEHSTIMKSVCVSYNSDYCSGMV
jgi:hypothetical protein